jgi:hypothetical protein
MESILEEMLYNNANTVVKNVQSIAQLLIEFFNMVELPRVSYVKFSKVCRGWGLSHVIQDAKPAEDGTVNYNTLIINDRDDAEKLTKLIDTRFKGSCLNSQFNEYIEKRLRG